MITVMGATGQVGKQIVGHLLEKGEPVRALGRSEAKLAELRSAGAEALAGDANDADFLTHAFRGADAVFAMLPHDPYTPGYDVLQDKLGKTVVKAIEDADVRHAVCLSSVGADLPSGTGFIASLYAQEQGLGALVGTSVLILRPGYFFENFYVSLETIRNEGGIADTIPPGVRIPMIATRDIAHAAAHALIARDWSGIVVRELLGPRDLSLAEVANLLGERIGKPDLAYVQISDSEMTEALMGAGIAADFAALSIETNHALSDGTIRSREGRTPENTTSTTFEEFAFELARAYQAAG
ncbi:MAG: NAD(P)H-binding protein [Cytophagales bacterium]|nr:NAD(P)H-binding protein [Armatimonadota bacterium]